MKKVLLLLALVSCFVACKKSSSSVNMNDGYVDMGLPSGTLWKATNEADLHTLAEATEAFGNENLPNFIDWFELLWYCDVEKKEGGCEVKNKKNGKTIFFPFTDTEALQDGEAPTTGSYLCSGISGDELYMMKVSKETGITSTVTELAKALSVRLVRKTAQKDGYVDLGLSSGVLWKATNEDGGLYTQEQAVKKFGDTNLPRVYMLQELMKECSWTWLGNGYHVQGPNYSSIFLPMAVELNGGIYLSSPQDNIDEQLGGLGFSEIQKPFIFGLPVTDPAFVRLVKIDERYVDLKLTSGAQWKNVNERVKGVDQYYTYQDAVTKFRDLPDKAFFDELMNECEWNYKDYYNVVKVTGPNKKYIFLPLAGGYSDGEYYGGFGSYWSATPSDNIGMAYSLYCRESQNLIEENYYSIQMPVRLVDKYVDLGLPSGTRLKRFNEPGYYTHEGAVNKFTAANLPTKEQIAELDDNCTWTWDDNKKSFIGKGPNGNKIIMPAAGYIRCDDVYRDQEERGLYWSSTLDDDKAYYLYLQTPSQPFVNVETEDPCFSFSVRLVK